LIYNNERVCEFCLGIQSDTRNSIKCYKDYQRNQKIDSDEWKDYEREKKYGGLNEWEKDLYNDIYKDM